MVATEFTEALVAKGREVAHQARAAVGSSMTLARHSTESLASLLESLKSPVRTLADAGTRFTTLSQRYAERMVSVNATVVGNALADGAGRLRTAARATDLRTLVRDQLERMPASRARIASEWRDATEATTDAGRELKALADHTWQRLAGINKPARKTATRKASSRKAKTPARRKSPGRKTTRTAAKRRPTARKTASRARKAA